MQTILDNANIEYNETEYDVESVFSIHRDSRKNLVFNLNETTYFNIPQTMLKAYLNDHPLHWSVLSFKIYGTTRLAWFLMKINGIQLKDAFTRVAPATTVFYIDSKYVTMLLNKIKRENISK